MTGVSSSPPDDMRLSLLRHGLAESLSLGGDLARELTATGREQARQAARLIAATADLSERRLPDLILCSPAARTRQTANAVIAELRLAQSSLHIEPRLYLASVATLQDIIDTRQPRPRHLLIVGHNPGLSELALQLGSLLSGDELSTGELLTLDYSANRSHARRQTP